MSEPDLTPSKRHPGPERLDPESLACERLLKEALDRRATDLHLDPTMRGYELRYRIDGRLVEIDRLTREVGETILNQFKSEAGIDPGILVAPRSARRTYEFQDRVLDVRYTFATCISGQKLALRLLDPVRVMHQVSDLGLSEDGLEKVTAWLRNLNGMFLVTGPTGSGKTTTLYALLHEMAGRDRHILTIEDPVEYEIDGINQIQVDPRHGVDFANGLKAMLRMDPDFLMMGEMREAEAAEVCARAAISGHVTLSTLHARNAVSAVTALRNLGLTDHQIAVSLSLIVSQRLVRKLCESCARLAKPNARDRQWLEVFGLEAPEEAREAAEGGCEACEGRGYLGRTGVFEIWHLDEADYEMLLAGADEHTLWRKLIQSGHRHLLNQALEKVKSGVTSLDEIRGYGESVRMIANL